MTGEKWGHPLSQLWKRYTGPTSRFGTPKEEAVNREGNVNVWSFDERGSFNAVCGFLRRLGVRWYLPGELGEVVPSLDTIPLETIDETIRPDFNFRNVHVRMGHRDTAMWAMHLGFRDSYNFLHIAHGLALMTNHREEILKAHPKWFALYGGKRQNQPTQRYNHLCYSNEELVQEAARFARAQFDHLNFDVVSIMPPDGYTAMCQCKRCEGKDTPERGYRGGLSDYIWGFVNRVAKEVKKTHPDKMISNCAYGIYTLPPLKIDKLEPNVQVIIVGGRRPTSNRPEQQELLRQLREDWVKKTDNPIIIFENYPFTDRGWYLPSFVPHALGESVNATKGISQGEDIWLSGNFDRVGVGYNHFPVYFTQRMYWGGRKKDVDALFDEYCHLFYGSAGEQMKVFFEYCEDNWQDMEQDKTKADGALERFAAAKTAVAAGSVFGRRIALVDEYLEGLRNKSRQMGQKRGLVPQMRLLNEAAAGDIVIDGQLDEAIWAKSPYVGRLRELQTGRLPTFGTTFKAVWGSNGSIYFGIRCEEHLGQKPNVGTVKNDDSSLWYGDVIEILLETESHSYYQIAVNPSGAIADLDRAAAKGQWFDWDSKAVVATRVADDHWTLEIRIPVVQDKNDPLHQIIGRKPSRSLPWHFNICRQRIRDNGQELSAFSPTGTSGFHEPMKFAHLFRGLSRKFSFATLTGDYLEDSKAAIDLMKKRRLEDALAAFVAIAERDVTDFQKSSSFEQAATCARLLKDYQRAAELADQIPLETIAKTVRMENLLAKRKSRDLVEQFGQEDLSRWPFWQIGHASFVRGRAHALAGDGIKAEADFKRALEFSADKRTRLRILHLIGNNREKNLKNGDLALEAYRQMIAEAGNNNGSAEYFRCVQDAARILRGQKHLDDALATLRRVNVDKLHGYWRGSILCDLGETLAATGRKADALAAYRAVLADDSVTERDRKKADSAIQSLGGN